MKLILFQDGKLIAWNAADIECSKKKGHQFNENFHENSDAFVGDVAGGEEGRFETTYQFIAGDVQISLQCIISENVQIHYFKIVGRY